MVTFRVNKKIKCLCTDTYIRAGEICLLVDSNKHKGCTYIPSNLCTVYDCNISNHDNYKRDSMLVTVSVIICIFLPVYTKLMVLRKSKSSSYINIRSGPSFASNHQINFSLLTLLRMVSCMSMPIYNTIITILHVTVVDLL